MGWRERFGIKPAGATPAEMRSSSNSRPDWADPNIDDVRAATAASAGRSIDVSYISDDYLAGRREAQHWVDEGEKFAGPDADAVIQTYGGDPIGRFSVTYGHHAACLGSLWLFYGTHYENGVWRRTGVLLKGYGPAHIVGACDDGSPVWEFRI
jgi:hypothetical protein